ncbi:PAS domain-containing protein [Flammeovirgaceae bacterium 311]|nr:PAS domain-containing protein [Flammeovirgaceae bacterium 311]
MSDTDREQEKKVLEEHIKAQEEMLARTTTYLMQAQEQLEVSRKELFDQNKNLERIIDRRTAELKQAVTRLEKEAQHRESVQQSLYIANHELNTLLYRSSHDFKGPVCTAFGLLSLIGNRIEDQEIREYMQMLHQPLRKLESLTRTITTIADFRQSQVSLQEIDLNALLDKVLGKLKQQFGSSSPALELNIRSGAAFRSDEYLLDNILQSITDNAFRYRISEKEHQVSISLQPYYKQLKITVSDNGTGIPRALQHRVFDMFFRGSELSVGSGLGLYLSKMAVDKLGGKIEVKSEENRGCSVTICLPGLN